MIFNDLYETNMVEELQKIIRTSAQIEVAKTTAHTNGTKRNSIPSKTASPNKLSLNDLNQYSISCDQVDTIRRLKNELSHFVNQISQDLDRLDVPTPSNASKRHPRKALPDKQFAHCNSLLTDLLEVRHFRTIYNIFVVILLMLLLNTFVHDYVADGSVNVGLQPIRLGFGRFYVALFVWAQMETIATLVYPMFMVWAKVRNIQEIQSKACKYWDYGCLISFVSYQCLFIGTTVRWVFVYNLPIASSIAVLMELTRFLMKNHAFVRSNAPKVWKEKPKADGQLQLLPSFYHFVYFQFAPTLVYRDAYPRTSMIRWPRVAWNIVEVAGVIFYVSFIFERFLVPYFRAFGDTRHSMTGQSLVVAIFGCVLPATIANLCGFYCLLHAWMNGWAEVMRFGDRQFYRDWWNASSFDVYYRTWNCVVHDWLYTYVYKDLYETGLVEGSKAKATFAVFALSAVFHEFILAISFRFFYPVLFTMFLGVGMLLSFVRLKPQSTLGNIFLWFSIAFGNGLCISLYCMEYFARLNCPVNGSQWSEYFVPVSWRCNGL